MNTGWNWIPWVLHSLRIINLLGNEYWLELDSMGVAFTKNYKPTGK